MAFTALLVVHLAGCLVLTPPWGCRAQAQTVTVSTPLGNVTGRVTRVLDRSVNQFLGVPYAQPPVSQLRFSKPVAVQAWSPRTLDAAQFAASCPQPGRAAGTNEDCLYLNVYVRANDSGTTGTGLRPVMIWIHGGGFVVGSGSGADGSLMAVRGNVVVVTINYRLGMLGWLSTLDRECPGNYGLWDQKMAIEWVRDNIASFGGDPSQITIFGESGGGYTVGLLAVSPLNNGLFQRAIMQSGTALNRRTIALDPRGFAERLADGLGCLRRTSDGFDTSFLVACARQRPVANILTASSSAAGRGEVAWILDMAPVIDGELLPTDVRTLLVDPRYRDRIPFWNIDVMVGTTNAEGSLVASPLVPFQRELEFNIVNGIPTRVLCTNVTTALARDYLRGSRQASTAMCQLYTSRRGDADQARQVVDLYGDMMFVAPAVETLLLHANTSLPNQQTNNGRRRNSFQYLFSHTPRGQGLPYQWFRGAGHGAEVNFVFGMFMTDQEEARLSLAMMDAWTNFGKHGTPNDPGNPAPTYLWPSYDPTTRDYTNLDLSLASQRDIYSERMRFWLQTIPEMNTETPRSTPTPPQSASRPNFVVTGSPTGSATGSVRRGGLGTETSTMAAAAAWGSRGSAADSTNGGVGSFARRPGGFIFVTVPFLECLLPIIVGVLVLYINGDV